MLNWRKIAILLVLITLPVGCGGLQDPSKQDLKSPCVGNGLDNDPCAKRDILLNTYFLG